MIFSGRGVFPSESTVWSDGVEGLSIQQRKFNRAQLAQWTSSRCLT